jgi:hypothetical protein
LFRLRFTKRSTRASPLIFLANETSALARQADIRFANPLNILTLNVWKLLAAPAAARPRIADRAGQIVSIRSICALRRRTC